jgi:eukaryotic-like serine/threonine-protein kinase
MIGKIIFHYKILEKLGEGGMGVVYKAEDSKLNRIVALKFLPWGLETHESERARFLQEAKAAAALNHANICTIHDVIVEGEYQFIVMEYVDGKTLRRMVPVQKIQDVIDYSIQIGEALQEAHCHGVVHRDIKTENIMINTRNQVKVMDFGLAKLKGSLKLTKTSSTIGTLAYMSPEQIQGNEVDGRSDIFSFGVVLYEMLAGELPFRGDYEAAMVYSIVNEEPLPVNKYRPEISSEVLHILNRSLEKNPDERYQNVREMIIDLKRVKKESAHAQYPISPQTGIESKHIPGEKGKLIPEKEIAPVKELKISRKLMTIMAVVLCFLVIMSTFFFLKPFSQKPLPPVKIVPFASSPGVETDPAFSPDGDQIAYSWNRVDQKEYDIYVKLIGAGTPLRLTRNPGNHDWPAWSPDGSMVAFLQISGKESGIYKIPALGGVEQQLLAIDPTNNGAGLDWSPDGRFIIYSNRDAVNVPIGIFMLSLANLEKHQITFPPDETYGDDEPAVSPNGRWIAFRRHFSWETSAIFIMPFSGGLEKRITKDNQTITDFAWSQDGSEIIFSSNRGGNLSLWRIPYKGGEPKSVAAGLEDVGTLAVSRKGHQLAYTKGGNWTCRIWKGEMPGQEGRISIISRLLTTNQFHWLGRFSPDGRKIAFSSYESGSEEIWVCDSDGANPIQLTNFGGPPTGTACWSPNNQYIAFDSRPQGNSDIFIMNANGGQKRRMTTEPSDDAVPTWSMDGHWIYFSSNRNGSNGIWKLPVNGGDAIQVSKEGGIRNFESQDGKWLFNHDGNGNIWKLSLENGQKQLVLDNIGAYNNWILEKDGIYYLKGSLDANESYIMFLRFASNSSKKLARLQQKGIWFLDISPDQRSFLTTDQEIGECDIYLVENFR